MIEYVETKNLILRKAKEEDLDAIWNNIWKHKSIADNMLWEVTDNIEDAKARLTRTIEYQSKNYAYFVCLKESNEPIGFAGVVKMADDVYEDSGICVAQKHQGNGYGKEVVDALKRIVFDHLNAKRFIYGCFTTNERSRKVCVSQGFKYLETKKIIREFDNKEFDIDYYYLDNDMYKNRGNP